MTGGNWTEAESKRHFWIIALVRLSGAALTTLGFLTVAQVTGLPAPVGYGLIAMGIIGVTILPIRLARKWKSRSQ